MAVLNSGSTIIQEADAETLLEWSDRILTAETPEAVFH